MTGKGKIPASFRDMTGLRVGRLIVVGKAPSDSNGNARWHCICGCGNKTISFGWALRNGEAKSCGCLTRFNTERSTTHGKTGSPEYLSWATMRQRCTNPKNTNYWKYGERGIKVCERWLNAFEDFYSDMGPRPSLAHTLERRDNEGNYEPNNCYWATKSEQNNNKRAQRWVIYKGHKMTLTQAVALAGNVISPHVAGSRLSRGWPVAKAVENPASAVRNKKPGPVPR